MIGKKLKQRYEVLEKVGEGATSTVYKGMDTLLDREVALKILQPHVRDATRRRFFQEAKAAAQLNHPNIMAIYDMGEDDEYHFLVVEYVEGDALSAYIPAVAETVVTLGVQIARALDYAHQRGIIHRDIKPANIMVTPEGLVKIMDLGLARPREAKSVTTPGMVIGTPAYMSPEQAKGSQLDRRTDIYSLGIVLYEMATGELPFNADDITALLLQHVQQPPPPPRLIVPDLPLALEHVILRALEKTPSRRFQTSRMLADTLQAAIPLSMQDAHDAPTLLRPPDSGRTLQTDRLSEPSKRKRPVIRIVMADDHTLLRRMLTSFLETHDDVLVVAEAGDGDGALAKTLEFKPDVLILDLNMPGRGGLEVLPEIRQQAPDVKILVLTGREDNLYIMRALRSGAHGYLLKTADENKLIESIRKVLDDEIVLGKGIAERVVGGLFGARGTESFLTETEVETLLLIAAGYQNDEISSKLDMSLTQFVEVLASLMNKLNVSDRNAAALKALRIGAILLEDLHDLPPPSSA